MATTPGQQYLEMMKGTGGVSPATMADYQSEADRLSFLAPAPQRQSIYDLASNLSAGLAAQAASGQPASIGYGLTAGFNKFSEGAALRRKERDKYKQQIMMMAYESVEKTRAEQKALAQQAGTYDFELALERAKKGDQSIFAGLNSTEGRALNFLTNYKLNPNIAITNKAEFEAAKIYFESQTKQVNEDGKIFEVPKYNIKKLFPEIPEKRTVPIGTIEMADDGKSYRFKGGDTDVKENWEEV